MAIVVTRGQQCQLQREFSQNLAGVVQACGNAVDRGAQRVIRGFVGFSSPLPPQQFHLNQTHRIHVWISQPNRLRQHRVSFEQLTSGR